jgi:DnaJ-class molecular chaperone
MVERYSTIQCRGCHGAGVQRNKQTDMFEKCPVCGGCGVEHISNMSHLPPGTYCCNRSLYAEVSVSTSVVRSNTVRM